MEARERGVVLEREKKKEGMMKLLAPLTLGRMQCMARGEELGVMGGVCLIFKSGGLSKRKRKREEKKGVG